MSCPACERAARGHTGRVDFGCCGCMARLIASARPHRQLQQAHIEALARFHGPDWPRLWADVQMLLQRS